VGQEGLRDEPAYADSDPVFCIWVKNWRVNPYASAAGKRCLFYNLQFGKCCIRLTSWCFRMWKAYLTLSFG